MEGRKDGRKESHKQGEGGIGEAPVRLEKVVG